MDQFVERLDVSSLNSRDQFGLTSFARNLGRDPVGGRLLCGRDANCRCSLGESLLRVVLQPRICHLEHFPPRGAFFAEFTRKTETRARRCRKSSPVASRRAVVLWIVSTGLCRYCGGNALSDSEKRNLGFLLANATHHILNNRLHLICRERK